jgi:PhnB protein
LWTVYTIPHRPAAVKRPANPKLEETKMLVQPYLFFGGRCQEAIDFYHDVLGAEVQMLLRFKDSPEPPPPGMVPENWGDKVMHVCLKIGDTLVMASDGCGSSEQSFQGFSLSLSVANEAEADRTFAALSDRGQVTMPLAKTFFSPRFGMLVDRFGVSWTVVAQGEAQALAA